MGRIQSGVGLVTGVQIGDMVDQLMAIEARPRDLLVSRTNKLQSQQAAVTELTALLLSVQYISDNLGKDDLFDQRKVTSSASSQLAATLTGTPAKGTYQYTPLATAQSQQLVSAGFRSDTDPLGGGTLSFRFGATLERSADLEMLGGGEGLAQGRIRVTDRSGASAVIDLSTARSIDDILAAISDNTTISVTAVADGDHFRLIDTTGQTASNLKVEEVSGGSTAASLGLAGIDVAAASADGSDVLWLTADTDLDFLNDGRGVSRAPVFDDIQYTLRDGTVGTIDFSPIIPGGSTVDKEITLGEVLDRINDAVPGKLQAEIAPDGKRLVVTDLTAGGGTFELESLYDSTALAGLGLDGESVAGVITGQRILGGLQTVLLDSLNGGQGFGELGSIQLTDRSGATDTVDLSGAETLEEVLAAINAAAVGITASLSESKTGIELVDTSAEPFVGNLIVASADATGSAEKLGIAIDADVTTVASGDLHLQTVAGNTLLANLNGGEGVASGKFQITDSGGVSDTVDLTQSDILTVGDLIREINRLDVNVIAELNDTGDGIRVRDLADGPGTLKIEEQGSHTAADLHLMGEVVDIDVGGELYQTIDGASTQTIELDAADSLADLRDKINDVGAGVAATIFSDGSSKPYRLTLSSQASGKAGRMVIDVSGLDLGLQQTVAAQDALLVLGDASAAGPKILVSSASSTFSNVLDGVSLQIQQASGTPVTVTVASNTTNLTASVKTLVTNYNSFRDSLDGYTAYDSETNTRSVLTGDATALRLDVDLSRLLSGRFVGAGSIRSLAELGISIGEDGTLSLDETALAAKVQSDPEAIREFFTNETYGFSAKMAELIEQLAGEDNSLLTQRLDTLNLKIEDNNDRMETMTERLEAKRERLLLQFYRMESAVAKLQMNLSAIGSMSVISMYSSSEE